MDDRINTFALNEIIKLTTLKYLSVIKVFYTNNWGRTIIILYGCCH